MFNALPKPTQRRAGKPHTLRAACAVALLTAFAAPAFAGASFDVGGATFSVGAGVRVGATMTQDAAPNGDDATNFDVQSIRLYFGGKVNDFIKFTFNTEEIFNKSQIDVLDAIVQFEFQKEFNVWMGRMLTPADRIEMNGPYYALTWNQYTQPLFPSDQGGDAGTYGRDDGVTVWGTIDKFQYALGAFNGLRGFSNTGDNPLFATRIAYNFLAMEDNPAYYTSSTYYGGLGNVFTVGLSYQSQSDGVGNATKQGDFSGVTADVLSETVVDGGVITVEGEYKDFSADYTLATVPTTGGGCFCLFDGKSYFGSAAFLFSQSSGPGKFQPYVRYVENKPSDAAKSDLTEVGVNYVINGHKARLNFNYSSGDANISGYPGKDVDTFSFGAQLQF
ncbi:MAG TPA: hypothetical protein VMH83_03560 [Candidatus Acidoferrum sp.]|nr:hypothetical protein [Candidatus Acidoferrum sp.]